MLFLPAFDSMTDSALDKVSIVGDAYLATVGLPDPIADHTISAVHMAVDLTEAIERFNAHSRYQLKVRIGVDTSAVTTGGKSKGKRKLLYEL